MGNGVDPRKLHGFDRMIDGIHKNTDILHDKGPFCFRLLFVPRFQQAFHKAFGLLDVEPLFNNEIQRAGAHSFILDADQRAGVALRQARGGNFPALLRIQPEQAELIRNGGLAFAKAYGRFLLGDAPLGDQRLNALRLLKKLKILPLKIFQDRINGGLLFVAVDDNA